MKIAIVGCGKVGSTTAFALLYSIKPDEVMLIDREKGLIEAEKLDLEHSAVAISPKTKVNSSTDIREVKINARSKLFRDYEKSEYKT